MDSNDLRVFAAVARHGAMSRAAEALHTVQSNVTQRIRALEQEIGAPLFERHSRGVALAPAGQRLLPYAAQIAALLEDAMRAARDVGTPGGPLVVGSLETTAALRLSPLLARFGAAHPAVDLTLRTGTTAELIEQVLERRLEGAFVCGPVQHPELAGETVFREELVVASAAGRGFGEAPVRILVLRAGCSYRQRLEAVLARRGIAAARMQEYGTLDTILACVASGLGITLLPRAVVEAWRGGGVACHALPPEEAMVETVFVRRRDRYLSAALAALLALARDVPALRAA